MADKIKAAPTTPVRALDHAGDTRMTSLAEKEGLKGLENNSRDVENPERRDRIVDVVDRLVRPWTTLRAVPPRHAGLARGHWYELTLRDQLANIGSEFGRAARARGVGNDLRFENALARCLELFDLTLADDRWRGRRREIARAREVVVETLAGAGGLRPGFERLEAYFSEFAAAAHRTREEAPDPSFTERDRA